MLTTDKNGDYRGSILGVPFNRENNLRLLVLISLSDWRLADIYQLCGKFHTFTKQDLQNQTSKFKLFIIHIWLEVAFFLTLKWREMWR